MIVKHYTVSAGVDVENFPIFLLVFIFFVTSVVSDNTPKLLDDLAVISQLFNFVFNHWITNTTNKIFYSFYLIIIYMKVYIF